MVIEVESTSGVSCLSDFFSTDVDFQKKCSILGNYLEKNILNPDKPDSEKFLWIILFLYFKFKGNLRSSGFRKELLKILQEGIFSIEDNKNFKIFDALQESQVEPISQAGSSTNLDDISECLLNGDHKRALIIACEKQAWPMCFLIAHQIGPHAVKTLSKTYLSVTFKNESLLKSMLEVGLEITPNVLEADNKSRILEAQWRMTLIALLTVKSKWSFLMMKKLGDKLLQSSKDIFIPHALFILSSLPLSFAKASRIILLGFDHRSPSAAPLSSPSSIYSKLDDFNSILRTEIVVQVMMMRKQMGKVRSSYSSSNVGSVLGSVDGQEIESNFSLAPSSIKTSRTFHTKTSRNFDRDRSINLFQPFRFSIARKLLLEGSTSSGEALLKDSCAILSDGLSNRRYFGHSTLQLIKSQLTDLSNEFQDLKKLKQVQDLLSSLPQNGNGRDLDQNLSFNNLSEADHKKSSLNQSFQSDGLMDTSISSNTSKFNKKDEIIAGNSTFSDNSANRFFSNADVQPEVQRRLSNGSNSGWTNPFQKPTPAPDLARKTSGQGWNDPFAKPKPRRTSKPNTLRQSPKPVAVFQQHPILVIGEKLDLNAPNPNVQAGAELSAFDAENVEDNMSNGVRSKSNSVSDPFAFSQAQFQRSSSHSSIPVSTPMVPAASSNHNFNQPQQNQVQSQQNSNFVPPPPPPPQQPQNVAPATQKNFDQSKIKSSTISQDTFLGRMRNKIIRNFIKPGDNAVMVDQGLGSKLEAYFDEKLNRWVFPGADSSDSAPAVAQAAPPTSLPPQIPMQGGPRPGPGNMNRFRSAGRRKYVNPLKTKN